jgi:hypothetical protein
VSEVIRYDAEPAQRIQVLAATPEMQAQRRRVLVIFDVTGEPHSYSASQIHHLGSSAIGVSAEDVAAWAEDLRERAREGDYLFSLNRYMFLAERPSRASPAPA